MFVRSNAIKASVYVFYCMSGRYMADEYGMADADLQGSLREYMLYAVGLGGRDTGFAYDAFEEALPSDPATVRADVAAMVDDDLLAVDRGEPITVWSAGGMEDILDAAGYEPVETARFSVGCAGERYIRDRELHHLEDSLQPVLR